MTREEFREAYASEILFLMIVLESNFKSSGNAEQDEARREYEAVTQVMLEREYCPQGHGKMAGAIVTHGQGKIAAFCEKCGVHQ